jgi:hypothetical protein
MSRSSSVAMWLTDYCVGAFEAVEVGEVLPY